MRAGSNSCGPVVDLMGGSREDGAIQMSPKEKIFIWAAAEGLADFRGLTLLTRQCRDAGQAEVLRRKSILPFFLGHRISPDQKLD